MATLPLTFSVETLRGLREVLPFKGTFPIGNLIPGLRLGVDPHFSRASPLDRRDSLFIREK